jgi:hypothetical protein
VCPHPNKRAAQRWLDHVWLYLRILWCKLIARQRATRQESEMANVYVLNTSALSAQISINNGPTHNLSAWRLSTQTAPQVPYFSVPRTRNVDQNGFSNTQSGNTLSVMRPNGSPPGTAIIGCAASPLNIDLALLLGLNAWHLVQLDGTELGSGKLRTSPWPMQSRPPLSKKATRPAKPKKTKTATKKSKRTRR